MKPISYNYHPVTFEFVGASEADESPLEPGVILHPAHSTPKQPPATTVNEVAVFSVSADAWSVVPDFRGQKFYDQTSGAEVVVDTLGAVAANLAEMKPLAMALSELKTQQTASINAACAAQITVGFTSSALGAPHSYTCTLEDQANLIALLTAAAGGKFTCVDSAGVKARPLHTDSQLRTVLTDGSNFKEPLLDKARMLKDQIASIQPSATALADVAAIVW